MSTGDWHTISRDPVSRWDLERRIGTSGECKWCGGRGRYFYRCDPDRLSRNDDPGDGPFCSVGCYRSWNG